MIDRDELIEAFTDAYHNIGIAELDHTWTGEYFSGDHDDPAEYPELEIHGATWEDIGHISFRFIREYFAEHEVQDILDSISKLVPLEVRICTEYAINDGEYLTSSATINGELTITNVEVSDDLLVVTGKVEYIDYDTF